MKTLNNNTKKAQAFINAYKRSSILTFMKHTPSQAPTRQERIIIVG